MTTETTTVLPVRVGHDGLAHERRCGRCCAPVAGCCSAGTTPMSTALDSKTSGPCYSGAVSSLARRRRQQDRPVILTGKVMSFEPDGATHCILGHGNRSH